MQIPEVPTQTPFVYLVYVKSLFLFTILIHIYHLLDLVTSILSYLMLY